MCRCETLLYTIQVFRGAYWNTTGKGGANWRRGTYWIQGANSNFYGTSTLEATLKKTTHSSYTLHSSIHIQGCLGYTLVSVKIRDVLNGFPVFMSLGDLQIVLQSNFIPEFEFDTAVAARRLNWPVQGFVWWPARPSHKPYKQCHSQSDGPTLINDSYDWYTVKSHG